LKQANVIDNRENEKYKRSLLATSIVLLFAAQSHAATATSVVASVTSGVPGGFIFDGTNNWVADAARGLCRMDPNNGGFSLSSCVQPSTKNKGLPIIGQPAFDPAGQFVYLPDQSIGSNGIWRYTLSGPGGTFGQPVNIAGTAGLDVQQPGAIAFGPDGNLYATMTATANIVRVNNPAGAAQTVDIMSTTISGLPAHGLAIVGTQLWVADQDGILDIVDPVGCANKCRGAILTQIIGLTTPLSITWDAINSYAYIGTASGVIRHARITGVTDTYSRSYLNAAGVPGLFSNVTAVGLDGATGNPPPGAANLLLVDDATAGQVTGGASVYSVPFFIPNSNPPVQSLPDGQGATPQPPITVLPTIFPIPVANPGVLYTTGLTTPKGAVFMGTHLWVVDAALGFCKVDPSLPSPSLTACAALPLGFVPGAPAFDPVGKFAYLPDTTAAGAGILRFPFNTVTETLGVSTTVVKTNLLVASAPGSSAPTALAFGPDKHLYAAMAGSTNILRVTFPATAKHTVTSTGTMFQAGSVNLAFYKANLFDVELTNSSTLFNDTLCNGTCTSLFLAVVLNAPAAVAADANFVYIGDAGGIVWRYDPVADTMTRLADTGEANGAPTPFSAISGIAVDNLGQVTIVDQTTVWKLSTAVPAIISLAPNQAPEGSVNTITITGTDFQPALVVNTCSAIVPGNVTFVNSTKLTATFSINPLGPLGACAITVTTANGTSAASNFKVLIGPPALGVITPSSGFRGRTVPVSITGANMTGGTLNAIPGITITGALVTDTLVTANFAIDPAATLGAQNIIVTTPSGPSNALTFTISAPPPVLTKITPSQGVANSTVPVILTGTDLVGATLNLPTGFTFSGTPVVTSTSVTATLLIDSTVAAGSQSIAVTTTGGTSNAVIFKILPALTSITPNLARAGTSTNIVLAGTSLGNLAGVTAVNAGANITVTALVASATQVTATFTSLASAPAGAQSITVTDVNGTSNAVTFTITGPVPVLTGMSPNTGGTGATIPVTLTGTGLVGATLNLPPGVTLVAGTLVNNSFTTVSASLLIAGNAPLGLQTISVTTPGVGNTSNGLGFTTFALAPLLISPLAPTSSTAGVTIPVTLNGSGFGGATSVDTLGTGITVSGFTVNLAGTKITATFVIGIDATTQNISVTNPNGTSNTVPFSIVPKIATISPASGVAGQSVPVTITGTTLTGATAISTGTAGITVSNLVVVSSTQITATFQIAPNAVQGNHSISVVTPAGTTTAVTFNVLPPAPAITSLNNTTISKRSNNIGMNVNGTNLGNLGIGSVQVLLNGVAVGNTIVSITNFQPSQTKIGFNWTFLAAAPISGAGNSYTITVTTPSGTSNAFPFTVTN
jgi:hypothetical protein